MKNGSVITIYNLKNLIKGSFCIDFSIYYYKIPSMEVSINKICLPPTSLSQVDIHSVEYRQLEDSLRTHGLLTPIDVREKGEDYEIINGVKRFFALNRIGQKKIKVNVLQISDTVDMIAKQYAINAQVLPPSPFDIAQSAIMMVNLNPAITQKEMAKKLNLSIPKLKRALDIKMRIRDPFVIEEISDGNILMANILTLARMQPHLQRVYVQKAKQLDAESFRTLVQDDLKPHQVKTDEIRKVALKNHEPYNFKSYVEIKREMDNLYNFQERIKDGFIIDLETAYKAALFYVVGQKPFKKEKESK